MLLMIMHLVFWEAYLILKVFGVTCWTLFFIWCDQYQDWPCTLIWVKQKVMRWQLTMLSDTNMKQHSFAFFFSRWLIRWQWQQPAVILHHGNDNYQFDNFGGGIGIVALVYSRKDANEDKEKEKHEGIDVLRRVDEDMLLRISQLERTVNRGGSLRSL